MDCASCGTQIPASFGHAIKKNECPACGNVLMDEESMALIEELRGFILETVKVREETADTLAMALITTYDIGGRGGAQKPLSKRTPAPTAKPKVAPQKKGEEEEMSADDGIVKGSDLFDPNNPLSSEERDRIIQERVEEQLMKQAMIPSKVATRVVSPAGGGRTLSDREMAESPVLEAQRLMRLQRQEANQANNPSSQCVVVNRRDDS